MRTTPALALSTALVLLGCNVTVQSGGGTGGGSSGGEPEGRETTTEIVIGGAGGTAPGGSTDPIGCSASAAEVAAPVPPVLALTGGTAEVTTLPDPDSAWISQAVTTLVPVAPGAPSLTLPSDGHSALAVMFFDPGGALVDGAILTPSAPIATAPSAQTRFVPAQFATIQAAVDASQPGDTVQVAPGVYTEHVLLRSGVRLQGSGADQTTLDGLGQGAPIVDADNARGASVRGFRFVHAGAGATCSDDAFECAGDYQPAAIHALAAEFSCDPTTTVLIADNVFEDNHMAVMIGWRAFALVRNNLFQGNEHALVVNHGADNHLLVRENVFYANDRAVEGDATFLHIDHNVIVDNGVGLRHAHVQTAPPRCNAFFGNGADNIDDFGPSAAIVVGVDGNTSFDGPADVAPAVLAGCFGPGVDPEAIGFGTFAGSFGEAFEADLGGGG